MDTSAHRTLRAELVSEGGDVTPLVPTVNRRARDTAGARGTRLSKRFSIMGVVEYRRAPATYPE